MDKVWIHREHGALDNLTKTQVLDCKYALKYSLSQQALRESDPESLQIRVNVFNFHNLQATPNLPFFTFFLCNCHIYIHSETLENIDPLCKCDHLTNPRFIFTSKTWLTPDSAPTYFSNGQ